MFWLLACFLGGGFGADSSTDWHRVIIFMAAVFISIIAHELGHALTGLSLGAVNAQIQLHGMGGLTRFGSTNLTRLQKILMTAAGPGAGFLLAVIFFIIAVVTVQESNPDSYSQFLLAYFIEVMLAINIIWSIINLFPILPLDGGQILRDALGPDKIKLTCIISFITLALLGSIFIIATRSLYNLLVLLFLGSYTWNLFQQVKQK